MSDADSPSEDSGNKDEHDNYEELTGAVDTININDESSENENQMDDGSSENENQMDDGSDLPESPEATESRNNNSLKKALDELVQYFKEKKMLPDIVAELIQMKKLNTMILDLYDYDKGYEISFQKYEDDFEIFHGQYSYGVSLIEYIRDGEIPYEIFDKIYNYEYKLFYDGYVLCRLRIHFEQEDSMRSHFVLLRHTIQTINGECAMNCEADSSLDFETEKARLIYHYSPDLCLDPSPVVAEIIINNELNQHPFITPYLKHIIQNEKARREKGIREMCKKSASYSEPAPTKPKDDDWNFRSKEPTKEEEELSKMGSKAGRNPSILSYLKERRICYPDKDSYTGLHVEIENFVYEYDGCTRTGTVENIEDKLCIGVLGDQDYFYGAYKLDDRMKDYVAFYWWPIGSQEDLVLHVNAITKLELKLSRSKMKITHNRLFEERVEVSDGGVRIVRYKLENPVSQVILQQPEPISDDEDEDTDED